MRKIKSGRRYEMSNPNYPEGVTERDIDRIGEPLPLTEELTPDRED